MLGELELRDGCQGLDGNRETSLDYRERGVKHQH